MSDLQTIQNDLTNATTALDELRTTLRSGDAVDLDSFNQTVAATCDAATALPKDDAPQIREQLKTLLDELQAARAEIIVEQERLAVEIEAAGQTGGDSATED